MTYIWSPQYLSKRISLSNGTTTYLAKDIGYAFWKLGISKTRFKYRFRNDISEGLFETSLEGNIDDFAYDAVYAIIDKKRISKTIIQSLCIE